MGLESMSSYDRHAWEHSIKLLHTPGRRLVPAKVRERFSRSVDQAKDWAGDLPGADQAGDIVERMFEGTLALTFQPALRSVGVDHTVRRFARRHPEVRVLEDVRSLTLRDCDRMVPHKTLYTVASATQGGATALAVTGAEVSTTVTGGATAAVVVGAVATDAIASMAIMGRTIGVIACRYGYDVRMPGEELFAMGVLSLGAAGSMAAKAQALASLSRLTQEMMRHAAWKQLNEHLLVRVIGRVYQLLGLKLTQAKLGQAVPFFGIGINATLSAHLTNQTFQRAEAVYRLRFLSEQYGIDPGEWTQAGPVDDRDAIGADEHIVDVERLLQDELHAGDRPEGPSDHDARPSHHP